MALNVKILTAPLMNKVHLGTILVTAVLFGVIRMSGGGLAMKSRGDLLDQKQQILGSERDGASAARGAKRDSRSESLDDILGDSTDIGELNPQAQIRKLVGGSNQPKKAAAGRAPSRFSEDDPGSLNDLVDGGDAPQAPAAPARSRDAGGLQDIEKLVGLR